MRAVPCLCGSTRGHGRDDHANTTRTVATGRLRSIDIAPCVVRDVVVSSSRGRSSNVTRTANNVPRILVHPECVAGVDGVAPSIAGRFAVKLRKSRRHRLLAQWCRPSCADALCCARSAKSVHRPRPVAAIAPVTKGYPRCALPRESGGSATGLSATGA
jgi:hypothetical protein